MTLNAVRERLEEAFARREAELERDQLDRALSTDGFDVTLPGGRIPAGARHPVTSLGDRLSDVFVAMGYEVAEGP